MLIYVAGPYSSTLGDERRVNTERAIDAGRILLQRGHTPFIPHLTHYVQQRALQRNIDITYEQYMAWDMEILSRCDALLYLAPSPGADIERNFAYSHRLTVYERLEDIPPAAR